MRPPELDEPKADPLALVAAQMNDPSTAAILAPPESIEED
jgi:hypothetical protein